MSAEKVLEQMQQVKRALEEIERQLVRAQVPHPALADFKMAVDHTRMTLWALLSASESNQDEAAAAIVGFRVKRATEMCRQIAAAMDTNQVTSGSPELQEFQLQLKQTLERIHRG